MSENRPSLLWPAIIGGTCCGVLGGAALAVGASSAFVSGLAFFIGWMARSFAVGPKP